MQKNRVSGRRKHDDRSDVVGKNELPVEGSVEYENELVFRVILVSAFYVLLRGVLHLPGPLGYVFATIVSALVFSGFHYIGPLGDPFDLYSFVYRSVAGLVFSGLYILRGFGITAYTHSLYDLFLTVRLLG